MKDYLVKFTNEVGTCTYGEYKIRGARGQVDALVEARKRHLDANKGTINLPGFCQSVFVHISPLD